jgi:hypothetical protein
VHGYLGEQTTRRPSLEIMQQRERDIEREEIKNMKSVSWHDSNFCLATFSPTD